MANDKYKHESTRERLDALVLRVKAMNPWNNDECTLLFRECMDCWRHVIADGLSDDLSDELIVLLDQYSARMSDHVSSIEKQSREPTSEELEIHEFVKRMVQRQGTVAPNFDELYRIKSELDRRMLE